MTNFVRHVRPYARKNTFRSDDRTVVEIFKKRFLLSGVNPSSVSVPSSSSSSSSSSTAGGGGGGADGRGPPRVEDLNRFLSACESGDAALALHALKRFESLRDESSVQCVLDVILGSRPVKSSGKRKGGKKPQFTPLSEAVKKVKTEVITEWDELNATEALMHLLVNVLRPEERTISYVETIIGKMVKKGYVMEAAELISLMPEALSGMTPTVHMCDLVLHDLAAKMHLSEAWKLLDDVINKHKLKPGPLGLNAIIFGLVNVQATGKRRNEGALKTIVTERQRHMARAFHILYLMETELAMTPSTFAINTLIQGCIRCLWYTEAVTLLLSRMIPREGIGMYQTSSDKRFAFFGSGAQDGTTKGFADEESKPGGNDRVPHKPPGQVLIHPDERTFEILFSVAWLQGMLREMIYHDERTQREYLNKMHSPQMLRSRMWLSILQMKGILTCFCNAFPRLRLALEKSEHYADIMTNVERLAFNLKKALREERQFEIFVKSKCPLLPTLFPRLIKSQISDSYQSPMVVSITLHEPSILHMAAHTLNDLGRVDEAVSIVSRFFNDKFSLAVPDHRILKLFTQHFCLNMKDNPQADLSLKIYKTLVDQYKIKPSADAVAYLISALAFENRIQDIRNVVEKALSLGVRPSAKMYNPMMLAASKDEQGILPWTIHSVLSTMRQVGLDPNSGSIHVMVIDFIKRNEIEKALDLVRQYLTVDPEKELTEGRHGPSPVESGTISLILTSLIKHNRAQDAFKFCEELLYAENKQCRPTLTTYRLMIAELEKVGDISRAYLLFETVTKLVDIKSILSNIPVHTRSEDSTIQNFRVMYNALLRGFAKRRQRDMTMKLFDSMDPRLKDHAMFSHVMKMLAQTDSQPTPSGITLETLEPSTQDDSTDTTTTVMGGDLGDSLSSLVEEMTKNGLDPLALEHHPHLRIQERRQNRGNEA